MCFHAIESLLPLHPMAKRSDYDIHQQERNVEFWKVTPIRSIRLCFHPMGSLLLLHPRSDYGMQQQESNVEFGKVLPIVRMFRLYDLPTLSLFITYVYFSFHVFFHTCLFLIHYI